MTPLKDGFGPRGTLRCPTEREPPDRKTPTGHDRFVAASGRHFVIAVTLTCQP
jgi:hypothetical protein